MSVIRNGSPVVTSINVAVAQGRHGLLGESHGFGGGAVSALPARREQPGEVVAQVGRLRAERERAAVGRDRVGRAARVIEQPRAKRGEVSAPRIEADGGVELRESRIEPALVGERATEMRVKQGGVGLERERAFEGCDRVRLAARGELRIRQRREPARARGLDAQRQLELVNRLRRSTLFEPHGSEQAVGGGRGRRDPQRFQ